MKCLCQVKIVGFADGLRKQNKMDNKTNIQELKDKIKRFCEDRDWNQYHGAKDLAIGIITESS